MSDERTKHLSGEAFGSLEEAFAAMELPQTEYSLGEGQRQAILLAIGHLAIERPGWDFMLGEIADAFEGRTMYEQFKEIRRAELRP